MVSTAFKSRFSGLCVLLGGAALAGLISCGGTGGGDTDGGQGNDTAALGPQFVDNGGAGSQISFLEAPDSLGVGQTGNFVVQLLDPRGAALDNVQVICDSELGIAILEPSTGREHTNTNGRMSGVIGGNQEGSYLFECRAEQGFNLHVRKSIRVNGPTPSGFAGFDGAAGGTMGGGFANPQGNLEITTIAFNQNGAAVNTLDTSRTIDCAPVSPGTAEEYSNPTFAITLKNDSAQTLSVNSVRVVVQDGQGVNFSQAQGIDIAAGATVTLTDIFFTAPVTGADGANGVAVYPDGTTHINGTFNVRFTIDGTFADGQDVSVTRSRSVTLQNIDNCS